MDIFIKLLLFHIGWSVFPVTLVFSVYLPNQVQFIAPYPSPTLTLSPSHSSTPSNTETPTFTPTPKPTNTPTPSLTPTPSPTPLPTVVPVTSNQLDEWFTTYSNHYGVDRQKLWNVAVCESHLRPSATNGDYGGLYQFSTNTWISTRRAMNLDTNPTLRFNPEEAIRTASFKISTVGLSPWPNCGK